MFGGVARDELFESSADHVQRWILGRASGRFGRIRRRDDGSFVVDDDPSGQIFINGFFRLAKIRALEIWHSRYGQN
jgi:hypothetical protein